MQTITKVYDTYSKALSTIQDLESACIPTSAISVLANQDISVRYSIENEPDTAAAPGAGIGAVVGGAAGLLTGLGIMAIPGLGPVVAVGWLATTALGAVAGGATGGIVGSLITLGVPEDHAHVYSEAVRRGGTLLAVQSEDRNIEKVDAILGSSEPIDPVQQGVIYRNEGWQKFDHHAGPYETISVAVERERRFI